MRDRRNNNNKKNKRDREKIVKVREIFNLMVWINENFHTIITITQNKILIIRKKELAC